jgi:drug/metabolite transporter (DMT)-like permease
MSSLTLYALVVLFWGTSWLGITFQLGAVPPEVSVAYRFVLASAMLMAWCRWRRLSMRFGLRAHGQMALMGIFLFGLNYIGFYLAIGHIASGLAAVAYSTIVIMNILLGALFLRSPIRPRVAAGAVIGLAGITLVFWNDVSTFGALGAGLIGLAWSMMATLFASVGNIISAASQRQGLPVVQANAYSVCYGGLLTLAIVAVRGVPLQFEWTVSYVGSLLYLAIFASVLGFTFYLTLLGRIGADRAAYATVLFPIVALTLSTVFEGYEWTVLSLIGVVVVLVGNLLVLSRLGTPGVVRAGV